MVVLVPVPPAEFDHPYHGKVIEQRLSRSQVESLCHGPACSWRDKKAVCHIAIVSDIRDGRVVALVRRHELGHCNGWPADHPNVRWVEKESGKAVKTPSIFEFLFGS
jgi:hypothetical protein